MTGTAYVNGRFVPAGEVTLPLDDAGVLWGALVTDRLRTFSGRLFRLADHLHRFRRSCELARVPQPLTNAELADVSDRLCTENWAGEELTLVWLATPGVIGMPAPSSLIAYTQPIDQERIRRLHRMGARLSTVAAAAAIDPRIKHRSRLAWWIATQQAHDANPGDDPLFLDPTTGHILETPTANLVAVLAGTVTSPPAGTVLEGVSLGVVRELCRAGQIPFAERAMTMADLARASEVLVTNTTYCVAGVSRIDESPVPFPGPILNRLLDAWTELVGTEVRPRTDS